MLSVNTLLQNRYRVLHLLGAGGMGAVYLAEDLHLRGRRVVVKENQGGDARQFEFEARILAALNHPNLPRVSDHFVEVPTVAQPNGAQYLVMDYIEGTDLDAIVAQRGAIGETFALEWMRQILDAVKYLHANRIIHRDIKPQNIIVTPQGNAIIVDFGIAKIRASGQSTVTGARAASDGYAPPEQYGGGGTDVCSDVYALGATLYFLLTGSVPPSAPDRAAGLPLTPPRQIARTISATVETATMTALNLPAQRRHISVDELERALFAGGSLTRWNLLPVGLGALAFLILCSGAILLMVNAVNPGITSNSPTPAIVEMPTVIAQNPTHTPSPIRTTSPIAEKSATPTLTTTRVPSLTALPSTRVPPRTATVMPTTVVAATQKRIEFKEKILVVDAATGNPIATFASAPGIVSSAVWSADGKKILTAWFKRAQIRGRERTMECGWNWQTNKPKYCKTPDTWERAEFGGALQLMGPVGENPVNLAYGTRQDANWVGDSTEHYRDAIWSPDGTHIAALYMQPDGNRCPFILGANGSGLRKLANCEGDDHPRYWSVDGKWLVVWSERGLKLYAYEVDGSQRVPLDQLGKLRIYDQRYYPWRQTDNPVCKGAEFWACE